MLLSISACDLPCFIQDITWVSMVDSSNAAMTDSLVQKISFYPGANVARNVAFLHMRIAVSAVWFSG